MHFVFLTTEANYAPALRMAAAALQQEYGITITLSFCNTPLLRSPTDWEQLAADLARADFIFGSMLFGEELVRPLEQLLRQVQCPVAMIMSNPALIRCTRLGKFVLQQRIEEREPSGLRKWLRAFQPKHGHGESQRQIALVQGMSKMLKYLPGSFRDLHSYIAIHQFWMHNSPENLRRMLCMLIERYGMGPKVRLPIQDPLIYPDTALFHPDAPAPFPDLASYQAWRNKQGRGNGKAGEKLGRVGLLTLRVVALGGNTAHLGALVQALEARGLEVYLAYSAGLDGRPAVEQFFIEDTNHKAKPPRGQAALPPNRRATIDLLVTSTGFALVGGPAGSRPEQARASLEQLDVAFLDLIPLVFQRVAEWQRDDRGLNPLHLAMNVALPELEGASEPLIYAGPGKEGSEGSEVVPLPAQIDLAAARIARRVALHRKPNADKRIGIVLFNFPPNLGNAGTAAYLDVFASVHRLLRELKAAGYTLDLPASPEALRHAVVEGNALVHGSDGNVAAYLPVEDYRRLFPHYVDIEPYWGSAPGELLTDGKRFLILGRQFGNVFVGIQPSFGYERDPMRLLMAKDAAPHHGFAAFYTWLERVFGADAVLHFGTHGALEFMPGKQAGLSSACWPTRLLGTLPNVYYYCVNNPSEGTIAKRRSAATLVSYMVPPVQQAGLYKGLRLLKDSIDSYRQHPNAELLEDIQVQAGRLGLEIGAIAPAAAPLDATTAEACVAKLAHELIQVEQRLIPVGLHVLGEPPGQAERSDILALVAAFVHPDAQTPTLPQLVAAGLGWNHADLCAGLASDATAQARWQRVDEICREAIRLFVQEQAALPTASGQTAPPRHVNAQSANSYLAKSAHIPIGKLDPLWAYLADLLRRMLEEQEIAGLLRALRGGYIPPSPGNDVVRNPAVVPTGRNIHGLDPFHMPSAQAQASGARVVSEMLERMLRDEGSWPETVALVLWGTDNLKTDGEGVAQALALLGARVIVDELGKVANVELIPLSELGRPRIDIVATVSGIFRDLLAHQVHLIDRAARLAAAADEPIEYNFVRKHALAQAAEQGISLDEAAARVFSNAPGSYGANVNHLVESSTWEEQQQLSDTFLNRKGFAYSPTGEWRAARPLMEQVLATVDVTFQNVDSVEIGISDVDHYYEYLGGMTKSVEVLRGKRPPVLVGEAEAFTTAGSGRVRSLEQMVRLESRAKLLNPKWYEGMLAHGYEGVHEIEIRVSNTYGWSATADAVEGWVYQGVAETYVLDEVMRERLAQLNPHASAALTRRLLEAHSRGFWAADEATLEQLRAIYADLEDRLEGIGVQS